MSMTRSNLISAGYSGRGSIARPLATRKVRIQKGNKIEENSMQKCLQNRLLGSVFSLRSQEGCTPENTWPAGAGRRWEGDVSHPTPWDLVLPGQVSLLLSSCHLSLLGAPRASRPRLCSSDASSRPLVRKHSHDSPLQGVSGLAHPTKELNVYRRSS